MTCFLAFRLLVYFRLGRHVCVRHANPSAFCRLGAKPELVSLAVAISHFWLIVLNGLHTISRLGKGCGEDVTR